MQLYAGYVRFLGAQFKCCSNVCSSLFRNPASEKTILTPLEAVNCRSFRLLPKLQQEALRPACTALEKSYDYVAPEICFDGRNKIIIFDTKSFIHIFELNEDEDTLLAQEFRSVLSNCVFHYDVNVNYRAIEHQVLSHGHTSFTTFQPYITSIDFLLLTRCNDVLLTETQKPQENKVNQPEKPTEEKLVNILNHLTDSYSNFFRKSPDFSLYRKDVVFHDNFRGIKTKGISEYKKQMYMLQIYGHLHFAKVKIEILKITHHFDDGTVRVRWRFNGLSRTKILFQLWKFKSLTWKEFCEEESEWLDGFSIFSIDKDGLVYKHFCDKMIPDDEKVLKPENLKSRILALLGVTGRPTDVGGLHAMVSCPSVSHSMKIHKRK